MLPKSRRISRADFKNLVRGKSFHGIYLSLFLYTKPNTTPSQFSFSASKKVSNKAVVRNKLRRRGYAIIRTVIKSVRPGHCAAFNFKKGSEKASFSEIKDTVLQLLKQSKII